MSKLAVLWSWILVNFPMLAIMRLLWSLKSSQSDISCLHSACLSRIAKILAKFVKIDQDSIRYYSKSVHRNWKLKHRKSSKYNQIYIEIIKTISGVLLLRRQPQDVLCILEEIRLVFDANRPDISVRDTIFRVAYVFLTDPIFRVAYGNFGSRTEISCRDPKKAGSPPLLIRYVRF